MLLNTMHRTKSEILEMISVFPVTSHQSMSYLPVSGTSNSHISPSLQSFPFSESRSMWNVGLLWDVSPSPLSLSQPPTELHAGHCPHQGAASLGQGSRLLFTEPLESAWPPYRCSNVCCKKELTCYRSRNWVEMGNKMQRSARGPPHQKTVWESSALPSPALFDLSPSLPRITQRQLSFTSSKLILQALIYITRKAWKEQPSLHYLEAHSQGERWALASIFCLSEHMHVWPIMSALAPPQLII